MFTGLVYLYSFIPDYPVHPVKSSIRENLWLNVFLSQIIVKAQVINATQVIICILKNLGFCVCVLDPGHRYFDDPVSQLFTIKKKFRVKKPFIVVNIRQYLLNDLASAGLESAVGVIEMGAERQLYNNIVAARYEFTLQRPCCI